MSLAVFESCITVKDLGMGLPLTGIGLLVSVGDNSTFDDFASSSVSETCLKGLVKGLQSSLLSSDVLLQLISSVVMVHLGTTVSSTKPNVTVNW